MPEPVVIKEELERHWIPTINTIRAAMGKSPVIVPKGEEKEVGILRSRIATLVVFLSLRGLVTIGFHTEKCVITFPTKIMRRLIFRFSLCVKIR